MPLFKSNVKNFADSGLVVNQWLMSQSTQQQLLEEVTPVTFGFDVTDTKEEETSPAVDRQLPDAPVEPEVIVQPESQSSETVITSLNADRFITSEAEKFDLGDAIAEPATSVEQPVYSEATVDNIDDNNFDCEH